MNMKELFDSKRKCLKKNASVIEYIETVIAQIEHTGKSNDSLESTFNRYLQYKSQTNQRGDMTVSTNERGTFHIILNKDELIIESKTPIEFNHINPKVAMINNETETIYYAEDLSLDYIYIKKQVQIHGISFPFFIYKFKCTTIDSGISKFEENPPEFLNDILCDFKNKTLFKCKSYEETYWEHNAIRKDGKDIHLISDPREAGKWMRSDPTCKYRHPENQLEYFKAVLEILKFSVDYRESK